MGIVLNGRRLTAGQREWVVAHPEDAAELLPEEVREVLRHLASVTTDILRLRFDPVRLRELGVYSTAWAWNEFDVNWALNKFEHLVGFYRDAAQAGQAVLVALV